MSKQLIGDEIAKAKAALHQQPLAPPQHDELTRTLADVEVHLQAQEPVNPQKLLDALRDWEARLEAEHPVAATAVGSVFRLLANIGV